MERLRPDTALDVRHSLALAASACKVGTKFLRVVKVVDTLPFLIVGLVRRP